LITFADQRESTLGTIDNVFNNNYGCNEKEALTEALNISRALRKKVEHMEQDMSECLYNVRNLMVKVDSIETENK